MQLFVHNGNENNLKSKRKNQQEAKKTVWNSDENERKKRALSMATAKATEFLIILVLFASPPVPLAFGNCFSAATAAMVRKLVFFRWHFILSTFVWLRPGRRSRSKWMHRYTQNNTSAMRMVILVMETAAITKFISQLFVSSESNCFCIACQPTRQKKKQIETRRPFVLHFRRMFTVFGRFAKKVANESVWQFTGHHESRCPIFGIERKRSQSRSIHLLLCLDGACFVARL